MIKKVILSSLIVSTFNIAKCQIGVGTTSPDVSSVLDVSSSNKGVLLPRVIDPLTDISDPATGLIVFDVTKNCIAINLGTSSNPEWSCLALGSGSGSTKVSFINCSLQGSGTLTESVKVSPGTVTQRVSLDVEVPGDYTISTTANGITFSASGTFPSVGVTTIVLEASGTPLIENVNTEFTIDFSGASCSFVFPVFEAQTGANFSNNGDHRFQTNLLADAVASTGVTQTITINPSSVGPYTISSTTNGNVTYSASGTFEDLTTQTVVLQATGIAERDSIDNSTVLFGGMVNSDLENGDNIALFEVTGTGAASGFYSVFGRVFWRGPDEGCELSLEEIPLTTNFLSAMDSVDLMDAINLLDINITSTYRIQWYKVEDTGGFVIDENTPFLAFYGNTVLDGGSEVDPEVEDEMTSVFVTQSGTYLPYIYSGSGLCYSVETIPVYVEVQ